MQQAIDAYFLERDEKNLPYTIESLAVALDLDRQSLLNYETREGYETFFDTVKRAKTKVLANFVDYSFTSKVAAALPIFLLKNNFNYEEKNTVEVKNYDIDF